MARPRRPVDEWTALVLPSAELRPQPMRGSAPGSASASGSPSRVSESSRRRGRSPRPHDPPRVAPQSSGCFDRVHGQVHRTPRRQDQRNSGLLRPGAVPGLPANHERRRDGRVSQEPGCEARDPQGVPARAGGAAQVSRSGSVHPDGPSLRVSESRSEEGRSGAEDRRARRDYGGPGVRAVGGGAVPYVLAGLERSLTVRAVGEAQVSPLLLLLPGPRSEVHPRQAPELVPVSDPDLRQRPRWLANSIVTTSSTRISPMRSCG